MPTISIITVNYNNRDGLERTTRSLEAQTTWDSRVEWIVVDGGSNDDPEAVLNACSLPSLHYSSAPDSGIFDAMNRGLSRVSGEWVLFLNSGDALADTHVIDRLISSVNGSDSARDVLVGDWVSALPGGERYRKARGERYLIHSLPSSHQAILFPTAALHDFEYDISYKITGDYYICAWLLRAGCRFRRLHYPVALFEAGGRSYENPVTLLREAARVQRQVSRSSATVIACSLAFRITSILRLRASYSYRRHLRGSVRSQRKLARVPFPVPWLARNVLAFLRKQMGQ
jgi:putative colanic acid biosynthesis glycosyltransferase